MWGRRGWFPRRGRFGAGSASTSTFSLPLLSSWRIRWCLDWRSVFSTDYCVLSSWVQSSIGCPSIDAHPHRISNSSYSWYRSCLELWKSHRTARGTSHCWRQQNPYSALRTRRSTGRSIAASYAHSHWRFWPLLASFCGGLLDPLDVPHEGCVRETGQRDAPAGSSSSSSSSVSYCPVPAALSTCMC